MFLLDLLFRGGGALSAASTVIHTVDAASKLLPNAAGAVVHTVDAASKLLPNVTPNIHAPHVHVPNVLQVPLSSPLVHDTHRHIVGPRNANLAANLLLQPQFPIIPPRPTPLTVAMQVNQTNSLTATLPPGVMRPLVTPTSPVTPPSTPMEPPSDADKKEKAKKEAQNIINEFYSSETGFHKGIKDFLDAINNTGLLTCLPKDKQEQFKAFLWPLQQLNTDQCKALVNPSQSLDIGEQVKGVTATVNSDTFKVKQALIRQVTINQDQFLDFITSLAKLPQVKANKDAMSFLQGQNTTIGQGTTPQTLMMQPVQRGMRYETLLTNIAGALEKVDTKLSSDLTTTRDQVKAYFMQANEMVRDRQSKAITLPMIRDFESQLEKLRTQSPSPMTTKKIEALEILIDGIKAAEKSNDIKSIRDYLHLAQNTPDLTASRGVLTSDTKKLINNHLTRVEDSIGKSVDTTHLDKQGMNLATYHTAYLAKINPTPAKPPINPITPTSPKPLDNGTNPRSDVASNPEPVTFKQGRSPTVTPQIIDHVKTLLNTSDPSQPRNYIIKENPINPTTGKPAPGIITMQDQDRQIHVDTVRMKVISHDNRTETFIDMLKTFKEMQKKLVEEKKMPSEKNPSITITPDNPAVKAAWEKALKEVYPNLSTASCFKQTSTVTNAAPTVPIVPTTDNTHSGTRMGRR